MIDISGDYYRMTFTQLEEEKQDRIKESKKKKLDALKTELEIQKAKHVDLSPYNIKPVKFKTNSEKAIRLARKNRISKLRRRIKTLEATLNG